jgi:diaminohydroxyphosphoribosylaminopyrimidine deaminase / 5-amino-6-(5-phosphoribosylamino)uracil reductase
MIINSDIGFMQLALDRALQGQGLVNPNPLVGAVIVKEGQIIGSGYHSSFGGPHAEVNAINNSTEAVDGATIYVTLEPCSYHGKTPPCANLLIKHRIKRVVIAAIDPNPLVSGKGIALLRKVGIEVTTGILEAEAIEMNRVFNKYITTGKPYIILKSAMSLDGKTAAASGDSRWISCEESRARVHLLRNELKGIMVGINTILTDDPELTCRLTDKTSRNPVRIIVDSNGRIPLTSKILSDPDNNPVILATTIHCPQNVRNRLKEKGHQILIMPEQNNRVYLNALTESLGKMGIDGILLEGGSTLNEAALKAGIVDEIWIFIAPVIIGGANTFSPVGGIGFDTVSKGISLNQMKVQNSGVDLLVTAKVNTNN